MSATSESNEEAYVIKCRGLPWSTTVDEVREFFSDCNLLNGNESIHFTMTREGRPSGEAFIEMASDQDIELGLQKDRKNMGKRYVEVFKAKRSEMEFALRRINRSDESSNGDNVIRMRGLPYEATKQDIAAFFEGLDITNNGILLTSDYLGRASGEAFVQFASDEHTEKALAKNKQSMGHRYIEVFRSSMAEAQRSQLMMAAAPSSGRSSRPVHGMGGGGGGGGNRMGGRPGPYDRAPNTLGRGFGVGFKPSMPAPRNMKSFGGPSNDGFYGGGGGFDGFGGGMGGPGPSRGMGGGFGGGGGGGFGGGQSHVIHMRGLPYRVTENDIAEWFSSVVDPIDIKIHYNAQGRPSGEADVLFASQSDARKALTKDRQNMQHRYVELFYDGPTTVGGGRGHSSGGGGGGRPTPLMSIRGSSFGGGY